MVNNRCRPAVSGGRTAARPCGFALRPCGWLKDKYGLSWQVVPTVLIEMRRDPDTAKTQRVTKAFLQMKKFDIAALKRAFEGKD